jgi:Flp pilus assembly protein TadD
MVRNLGVAYQNMSELDRPEEELRVAAQLSNRVTETERLKILGDYNLIIYNFDEACEDFRALVQLQPRDPTPYQGLGICYARKMDMDTSLAQTQKGLEMQPRSLSVRYNLSRTYFMKGDKARAIEVAQEILRENPSYADAMRIVGVTYELDGKFGEARRMFEGMTRSGGDGEVVGQSALADLALATGRYREARPHLEAGAVAADKQGDKLAAAREKVVLAELLFPTGSPRASSSSAVSNSTSDQRPGASSAAGAGVWARPSAWRSPEDAANDDRAKCKEALPQASRMRCRLKCPSQKARRRWQWKPPKKPTSFRTRRVR